MASVVKWSQRFRATGSAAAAKMGGWRPLRLTSERDWLLAQIAEKPDLTLRAVMAELAERGSPASYGAVWRLFKHEAITFKKSLHASKKACTPEACTPASRIAPTSPGGGRGGRPIKAGSIPSPWYSSTRLGLRPT